MVDSPKKITIEVLDRGFVYARMHPSGGLTKIAVGTKKDVLGLLDGDLY